METKHMPEVKLEPEQIEDVAIKEEYDEDESTIDSFPPHIKLEPEPVISEDSNSLQFPSVQKEELDIEDEDLFEEENQEYPSSSSEEDGDSAGEEGFESYADFVIHQRKRKQVVLTKLRKPAGGEPSQQKPPPKEKISDKTYHCRECEAVFQSRREYVIHWRHHRMQKIIAEGTYTCDHCQKPFVSHAGLKRHINESCPALLTKYDCQQCDKSFFSSVRFERHILRHQNDKKKKEERKQAARKPPKPAAETCKEWECEECGKKFPFQNYYHKHLLMHDALKNAKYRCETCQKLFSSQRSLAQHSKKQHKTSLPKKDPDLPKETTICPMCNKTVNKAGLKTHLRMHKYIATERYKCELCSKVFSGKSGLTEHQQRKTCVQPKDVVKVEDEPNETIDCPMCNKSIFKKSLKTHLRYHKYLDTEKYKCELCGKVFSGKHGLTEHRQRKACIPPENVVKLHDERKIYNCAECDKSFHKRIYLNSHVKRIHEIKQQGTFKCGTCEKFFGSKTYLAAHEQTHVPREQRAPTVKKEPEQPLNLVCSECGKGGFPTRKSIITHLKRVHENKIKG